jgi:hypothetical protein
MQKKGKRHLNFWLKGNDQAASQGQVIINTSVKQAS